MPSTLIHNAAIVTMSPAHGVISSGYLRFEDGTITHLGPLSEMPPLHADAQIDASGSYLFPGLVNMHTHSYQMLVRGIACDLPLDTWLAQSALPAAAAIDPASANLAARACALECLKGGTTTLVDMTPRPDPALQEAIAQGHRQLGVNAFCAIGMREQPTETGALAQAESLVRDAVQAATLAGGPLPLLAPYQLWNNSLELLEMLADISRDLGLPVITHAMETSFDDEACRQAHGLREIGVLEKTGLLNSRLTVVHGTKLEKKCASLLAEHDASVAYAPVCNLYLGSGIASVGVMRAAGLNVALCTEGPGCNNSNSMLESMKVGALLQKGILQDASALTASDVLEMATMGGARALGLEEKIGSLEVGKRADLFCYRPRQSIASSPSHDPITTLVYSYSPECVQEVYVAGEAVICEGEAVREDEPSLVAHLQETALSFARDNSIPAKDR